MIKRPSISPITSPIECCPTIINLIIIKEKIDIKNKKIFKNQKKNKKKLNNKKKLKKK